MAIKKESCYWELGKVDGGIGEYINMERINDRSQWFEYLGFDVQLINQDAIKKIDIIKQVDKITSIDRIVLLSMPEHTTYNWHVDDHRKATINLLINNHKESFCLFGESIDESKHSTIKLEYKKDTFYLFNTKKDHMVVNFGERRYILSMQFNSKLSYEEIKSELIK